MERRSELKRTGPPKRKTELKRVGPPSRGQTKIRRISPQQAKVNAEYTAARNAFMADDPTCEWEGCGAPATDCHHKESRGSAPDLRTDPENFAALCREHHAYITDVSPEEGKRRGLIVTSQYELRQRGE